MKLSKGIFLVVVTFALSSLAFAGPHNFDTTTAVDGSDLNNLGSAVFWTGVPQTIGLESFVYLTDGSTSGSGASTQFAGLGGTTYNWTNYPSNSANCDANGTHAENDGDYCGDQPLTYNDALTPQTGLTEIVIWQFFNVSGGNDFTNPESVNSFTSGASTYFSTVDPGYSSYQSFYELDINVSATDGTGGGTPTPAGIWRLGFGFDATSEGETVNVSLSNVAGTDSGQDGQGAYGIAAGCTVVEGSCGDETHPGGTVVTFADAEFDPAGAGSVPEPTTMLLLGSGLMFVARRFKR